MTTGCIRTELGIWIPVFAICLAAGCGSSLTLVASVDAAPSGVDGFATMDTPSTDGGGMMDTLSVDGGSIMADAGLTTDVFSSSDALGDTPGDPTDGVSSDLHSMCLSAQALPLQAAGYGTDGFEGLVDEYLPACGGSGTMNSLVEWFEILPGPDADVQIFATEPPPPTGETRPLANPMIRVYSECPPVTCVASSTNPLGFATFSLRFTPVAYRPYYVAIGGDPDGQFAFEVAAREVGADAPTNGTCSSALSVSNGSYLYHQNIEDAVDLTAACGLGQFASLFYAVHVGAGQALQVQATIENQGVSPPFAPGLRLASGCLSATCLVLVSESATRGQSNLNWTNSTEDDQNLILAVDSPNGLYRFDLSVQIGPSP